MNEKRVATQETVVVVVVRTELQTNLNSNVIVKIVILLLLVEGPWSCNSSLAISPCRECLSTCTGTS